MNIIEIIQVNPYNIDNEHICCAIADKKSEAGVKSKKDWLKARFEEGLVFRKANVRGKVFIEYIPAEMAWCPINAPGYMFINCLWVSGQYKGMGLGTKLFDACMKDSEGMNGIVTLSSKSKRPFLSDKKFLIKKGFEVCDTAAPYFELMVLRLREGPVPAFKTCAKQQAVKQQGMVIYYAPQCPFTGYYIKEVSEAAEEMGIDCKVQCVESRETAQNLPTPYTTYSIFYNGRFITHEIQTKEKIKKILMSLEK